MNKIIFSTFFFLLTTGLCFSQSANISSGGDISGSGGNMSYSVGQIVNDYKTGPNFSMAEGVQQPLEISELTSLNSSITSVDINVYPNPTSGEIFLNVPSEFENTEYKLIDINGINVGAGELKPNLNSIDMNKLSSSTYILSIVNSKATLKSFKIIKK